MESSENNTSYLFPQKLWYRQHNNAIGESKFSFPKHYPPRSQRAMYFCQQWIRGCHSHIAVATGDYLCSLLLFGLHNCSVIFCLNSRDEALSFAVIAMLQHLCVLWPSSGICQIGSREYNGQNMVITSAIFSSMEKLNGTSLICTYFHVRYNLTKLLLICCL